MEESGRLLLALAAVFVLGIGAQWLAWRLRLPSILLLLVAGFVAGPATGWIDPDDLLGGLLFPFVSLSLAMILFEGGLSLKIAELREIGAVLGLLLTVGVLITWALSTAAAWWLLGLPFATALLLGSILVVTGPTVIGPLLLLIRPVGRVGAIAKWEGIVVDPIGAVLAVLVFEAVGTPVLEEVTRLAVVRLALTLVVGTAFGLVAAGVFLFALRRYWIPDSLQSPVAMLFVVAAFTASHLVQAESGLLAVTLMGIVLANQRLVEVRHIVEFKENLRVLLIATLFVLLAARVGLDDFVALGWRSVVFVAVLMIVVRPAAVFLSTLRSGLTWQERTFLAWLAPRGIVAAAVASVFGLRLGEQGGLLFPATFVVIVGTVAVYGLTAFPLARFLGLATANPQGVLIAGAHRSARAIGEALKGLGQKILLVDTNRWNIRAARMQGLNCYYASILSDQAMEDIELGGIGRLLAMTPNDEVNSLATLHYSSIFGRSEVYQLVSEARGGGRRETPQHVLRGRPLFASAATYDYLARRINSGATIKVTKITEEFDFAAFRALYGPEALPLFVLTESGRLQVVTATSDAAPKPGQTLISLVDPIEEDEEAESAEVPS